ncbi:N-acetylglucosamine transferase, partial [Rhizobium johnstonii]
ANPGLPLAVLGFGDRSFPSYCGFAGEIAAIANDKGWASLIPFDTLNRQSPQDFARWGRLQVFGAICWCFSSKSRPSASARR